MTAFARSTITHQALIGPNFDTARGLDNRPVELQSGRIVRCSADAGRDRREGRLVRTGGMPDATGTVRKRDDLASGYLRVVRTAAADWSARRDRQPGLSRFAPIRSAILDSVSRRQVRDDDERGVVAAVPLQRIPEKPFRHVFDCRGHRRKVARIERA